MTEEKENVMEKIMSLAKRRGFVFQGSEIYGGLAGTYDFGPNGVELVNNIKRFWWEENVHKRNNFYGIDSAIFKHPRVWEASGHTSSFSDPLAECRECNARIRVDKELNRIGVDADEKMSEEKLNELFDAHREEIVCPICGKKNFSGVRAFNMLIKSNFGDFTSEGGDPVYLPGEASQGIYLNYITVRDSMHPKIPFGIAQIGKAFRNEISPRNFLFRTRELEQADTELFIRHHENKEAFEEAKRIRFAWYLKLGIDEKKLRFKKHENLVFYASDAWDIEYEFPNGFDEIEGIHDRTDYDLTQHSTFSKVDLDYTDEDGKKFTPWIIETSMGVGRVFLAVLADAYREDELGGEKRIHLALKPSIAPVKAMVSPLLKNKPELVAKAREVYAALKKEVPQVAWDDNGNIGKRYRRQDEIGTPFCLTIDFDTLGETPDLKDTVTLRHRDSGEQERMSIVDAIKKVAEAIKI